MALVVENEEFVKYSNNYRGNIAFSKTLEELINSLSKKTSITSQNPIIVIVAGIPTDDNLKMIKSKKFKFVCVTRSKLKDYLAISKQVVHLQDKNGKAIKCAGYRKIKTIYKTQIVICIFKVR